MNRLYTVFLTVVLALVCSTGASAGAPLNLTLNCDRANAIEWRETWNDADWKLLDEGANALSLTYDYGYQLQIRPVEGMRIDAMESANPEAYADISIYSPLDRNSLYPTESWEGRIYNMRTTDLSTVRTTKVVVNITDDPARFTVIRNQGASFSFTEVGENYLALDPLTELPVRFSANGGIPLYKIELDGSPVPLDANSTTNYTFKELTDGQKIDITANWPDNLETDVTITVPEDVAGVVKRVYRDLPNYAGSEDVEFETNKTFKVKGGYWYNLTLNTQDYVVNKLQLDGTDQYVSSSIRFWVGTEASDIVIDAVVKVIPKFTLRVERDNEAEYSTNGWTFIKLSAGDNEIVPNEDWGGTWSKVYLKAVDGFRLTKVECTNADHTLKVSDDYSTPVILEPAMDWLGRIYEVGTVSLESERTASVTVTVTDDPSKVTEAYRGAARIQLGKAGEAKTFGFNPGSSEAQFKFSGDLVPLNSVKVNGKAVAPDTPESLSHIITVADGDKIEITASYPEIEVPFTINVPEEVAGVVRSLKRNLGGYYNYENLDFTPNEPVMVPAGSCLEIEFNTSDYNLKSAKIGDYDLNPSGAKIFVLNDMVDVDLDAALWGVFNVTINLTDPSQVKVYPGEYPDVEPYALVAGANNVELDERKGAIFIKAESGFQINGVTDENGNLCEGQGNVYKVTRNGMVFNIESGELQYDGKWVLWIDTTDHFNTEADSYWGSSEYRGEYNYITEAGYLVHPYAKALGEQFNFFISLDLGYHLYINGELDSTNEYTPSCYKYFTPGNKIDVLRLYTTGEPAEKYDVEFVTFGDKVSDAKVVTDLVVEQPAWADGLTLLEGTRVAITLPADAEGAAVKLDDATLYADEDGRYVFDTKGNHTVTISTSSSITGIDADRSTDNNAVYNLMGVKVLDNASAADLELLPTGIYVVNGQKMVIR